MPEIKFISEWVKAEDNTQQGDHLRFLDVGEFNEENNRWTFLVGIVPKGEKDVRETKKFNLNKTNFKALKALYGSNSDNWKDKEMEVAIVQVNSPNTGEMVPSVRLVAPGIPGEKPKVGEDIDLDV